MNIAAFILSIPAGLALGILFYGGLWFTVRRLPSTAHPVLLTLGSFWIRLAVVLGSFLVLAKQGLVYLSIAMTGFVVARLVIARLLPEGRPAAKCI